MKHFLIAIALFICLGAAAQNVGIGTSSPNANAKLDVTATDKGVLIPRMDSVHRKAIPNTIGLLVYDSTTKSFWYNNGTAWQNMATAASGWSLTGNSGIDTSVNFLGTADDNPLMLRVNNKPVGKISNLTISVGKEAYSGPDLTIIALGTRALKNNIKSATNSSLDGSGNVAIGASSLAENVTGYYNTSLGAYTSSQNTTGNQNTAVGSYASLGNFTGNYNSAFGTLALWHNQYGSKNTALGSNSDVAAYDLTNATAVGYNAVVDASNKIRLGDANVTVVESNGVFNTVSDGRFKYNIQENVKGLDFIMKLRPVTYQFDTKKQEQFTKGNLSTEELNSQAIPAAFNESSNIKRTGFIAQEVATAAEKTGYDFDGVNIPASDKQYYSLSYASFVVPLVKAVQEQQQTIGDLKKQNEFLKQQNEMITERLKALETKK